ncbi:MAG: LLM class flavin-dependent oxidoreductase [Alphaproteobacteria bacterium]|nr:LLM class flavin-dependent oxidoreductase [Alphaproteobacteria bacterium]
MAIGVGLGLAQFPFSDADAFWRWVDLCEADGIDSLWQTDRVLSSQPFLDCMSVMAALAGRTRRLKFGMNVASVAQRDPVVLAKECATIDVLSNGRLLPAFGVGSKANPYWRVTGQPFKGAGAKAEEGMEIIARLWREEKVTFLGEHYRITDATISPRPKQQPLPLWIGGSSKAAIRRTGRLGTGWQAGNETPAELKPVIAAIKQAAADHGRKIPADHYGAGFHFRFGSWEDEATRRVADAYRERSDGRDPRDHLAVGGAADIIRRIDQYIEAGISKFILRPIGASDEDFINQTRLLAAEVIPEVESRKAP